MRLDRLTLAPPPPGRRLLARRRRMARANPGPQGAQGGQSLVEFSLVVVPLLLLLLAIVQFGFIFNAYVTMSNAAREAARTGTIYVYDRTVSKDANDLARNETVRNELLQAMNLLGKTTPQFATTSTWTRSGTTFSDGDLIVEYELPEGATDTDNRVGQRITVRATYHQDLLVPLIANLLPRDAGGRLALTAEVTMVVN